MSPSLAAAVAAAGSSSRMGTSKALLSPDGTTFLERVAGLFRDAACDPILVIVREESEEAELAVRLGLEVVVNPDPREGPISSLRSAIRALPRHVDGLAWCPVDHPLVRLETMERLRAAFEVLPSAAVVPEHAGRRGHPVIFPRALFDALQREGLAEGARSVLHAPGVEIAAIAVDDPGVLIDIDTPADLHRVFPAPHPIEEEA